MAYVTSDTIIAIIFLWCASVRNDVSWMLARCLRIVYLGFPIICADFFQDGSVAHSILVGQLPGDRYSLPARHECSAMLISICPVHVRKAARSND